MSEPLHDQSERREFREKVLVALGNLNTKLDMYGEVQKKHAGQLESIEATINKAKGGWLVLAGIPAAISFLIALLTRKL